MSKMLEVGTKEDRIKFLRAVFEVDAARVSLENAMTDRTTKDAGDRWERLNGACKKLVDVVMEEIAGSS